MSKVVAAHEVYAMAKELGLEEQAANYSNLLEEALDGMAGLVADKLGVSISFGATMDIDGLFVHFAGESEQAEALFNELDIDPSGEL